MRFLPLAALIAAPSAAIANGETRKRNLRQTAGRDIRAELTSNLRRLNSGSTPSSGEVCLSESECDAERRSQGYADNAYFVGNYPTVRARGAVDWIESICPLAKSSLSRSQTDALFYLAVRLFHQEWAGIVRTYIQIVALQMR